MSDVKKTSQALRDECNRLADEAMRKAVSAFDTEKKLEFLDQAQVYRTMAENHVQTRLHAEMARPAKFTKARGATSATERRKSFLVDIIAKHSPETYDVLVADAIQFGAGEFWPDEKDLGMTVWNFARKHRLLR